MLAATLAEWRRAPRELSLGKDVDTNERESSG